jgi:hypothetical protein
MKSFAKLALVSAAGVIVAPAAITDDLVAYWDFEGSTANHPGASGGSAYDGTLMDNASLTGGAVRAGSGSLVLDGAGDYFDVTSIVDPNQPWSVSAWYRPNAAPAGSVRYMVFESSGSYPISFGLREGASASTTNHQTYVDIMPGTDVPADVQIADGETAGHWHHVLLAFTPATSTTAGSVAIYINGILRNSLVIPAANTLGAADGFHIGTYRSANDRWFNGALDEVAIWNRTLSATEAQEIHQRGDQGQPLTAGKTYLNLVAEPGAGGAVSGGGLYDADAVVEVSATANPGYLFRGWTGEFTGQPAVFTHTLTTAITATAVFSPDTADSDGDGLSNFDEIVIYQTDPQNADSDGDEIPDGDEIAITGTDPNSSDVALVDFVRKNLSPPDSGAIALSPLRVRRDPATGALDLLFSIVGSTDQTEWQRVDLSHPSVSITPSGTGWHLTFPAPSNTTNSYVVTDQSP